MIKDHRIYSCEIGLNKNAGEIFCKRLSIFLVFECVVLSVSMSF